jgi:hypothetical protein
VTLAIFVDGKPEPYAIGPMDADMARNVIATFDRFKTIGPEGWLMKLVAADMPALYIPYKRIVAIEVQES